MQKERNTAHLRRITGIVCVLVMLCCCTVNSYAATSYSNIANSYATLYDVMFKTITPVATLALCFSALRVLTHDSQNIKVYAAAKRTVMLIVVAYAAFVLLPSVAGLASDLLSGYAWDPSNPSQ